MRHPVPHQVDQWSLRSSPLHLLGATPKLAALLLGLVGISLSGLPQLLAAFAAFLALALISGIPLIALLKRGALVLPFSGAIAAMAWLSGDATRALTMLSKSYLSALVALLFAATTPFPAWTSALHKWRVPATLILTLQFVYRYLFVIAEEAQSMGAAARARGGFRFSSAAGALGVLFARSWQRSDAVHKAMLARGYRGRFS